MGVYNGAMPLVHILVPVVNNDQPCPKLSPRWVVVRYATCARSAVFAMCELLDYQPLPEIQVKQEPRTMPERRRREKIAASS